MIGVVLDTNVIVPAALPRGGFEACAVDLVDDRKVVLFVTVEITAEYRGVLRRPRLRLAPKTVDDFLTLITYRAVVVIP